jgi:uncharacterized phage protein gp47/JayE
MPFVLPAYADIRDQILRNIQNQLPDAVVGPDSDFYARAAGHAAALEGEYQHQAWIFRQIFPDTADAEILEQHATRKGLTRKPATSATGTVRFTGTVGAAVTLGTEVKTSTGAAFLVTTGGAIGGGGSVDLAAQAVTAGLAGNQAINTAAVLTASPPGVASAATILTMTGGTDAETDASLLARLLEVLRNPPAGGNQADYRNWALAVPGITHAWVFDNRRAVGTVDIAVLSNGAAPGAPLIAEVQAYIDARRPAGAKDVLVLAPTFVDVAITAALTLSGVTLATASAAINSALDAYFATLGPGATFIKTRSAAIIADTQGVTDFNQTLPAGNVATLVDATHLEIPRKGVVTLT